jgi:purine nucleoside phosphorylase
MSSIHEVIVSRYYNMKVCMLSVVSNACFPPSKIKHTTIADVLKVMNKSAKTMAAIFKNIL